MNTPIETVRRVEDVIAHGMAEAAMHRKVDAVPLGVSLVVYDGTGWPGVLLSDGSVLVVPWNQLRPMRDALDKLGKLVGQEQAT